MCALFFSDGIAVFACYLTLQVAQMPDHVQFHFTLLPNLPRFQLFY